MAVKIFLTGATGYIGGDALYALAKAHSEWDFTAIVRNSDSGAKVAAKFPNVRCVYGTLEDSKLLEEESAKADIVIHTADSSDHTGAAKAIAAGLAAGHATSKPGYWIHVSGTGILTWHDSESKTFGEAPSQPPYNDLEDVSALTNLPDVAFHRDIDKLVLAAGAKSEAVKTAIVCPPTIYGAGRGPGNVRSKQVYTLANATLRNGQAPKVGKGLTEWDNVHVHDLSQLLVLLAEAAVQKDPELDSKLWGRQGYFLAENGHHVWGGISDLIGKVAFEKGYIKTKEAKAMSVDEVQKIAGFESLTWGLNSKGYARRARQYLGWKPTGKSLEEELPDIIEVEAAVLGMKPGHAEKAAGKV